FSVGGGGASLGRNHGIGPTPSEERLQAIAQAVDHEHDGRADEGQGSGGDEGEYHPNADGGPKRGAGAKTEREEHGGKGQHSQREVSQAQLERGANQLPQAQIIVPDFAAQGQQGISNAEIREGKQNDERAERHGINRIIGLGQAADHENARQEADKLYDHLNSGISGKNSGPSQYVIFVRKMPETPAVVVRLHKSMTFHGHSEAKGESPTVRRAGAAMRRGVRADCSTGSASRRRRVGATPRREKRMAQGRRAPRPGRRGRLRDG